MSFEDCLRRGVTDATDARLRAKIDERIAQYRNTVNMLQNQQQLTGVLLDGEAARLVIEAQQYELLEQKKRLLFQAVRQRELRQTIENYRTRDGKAEPAEAAIALLENNERSNVPNYQAVKQSLRSQAYARMAHVLDQFAPKKAGFVRPKANMQDMVREMGGQDTGNAPAKELAKGLLDGLEYMRTQANAAGASIRKREDWYYPQNHDQLAIASVSKQDWVSKINPRLAWDKIRKDDGTLIPADKRLEVLGDIYDTIKTGGLDKLDPAEAAGFGMSMSKRMNQSRFLVFKTPDDFIAYHEEFGKGSLYDSVINHIDGMAHNIALMKIFGPDVTAGKRFVEKLVMAKAADMTKEQEGKYKRLYTHIFGDKLDVFNAMFEIDTGRTRASIDNRLARLGSDTRNLITAAFLGSTSLIALPSDSYLTFVTKRYNGLESSKWLRNYLRFMNPRNREDRLLAMRSGLIAENALSMAFGAQRMIGEAAGGYVTERITDVAMRVNLLSPHTQAARWAFGMEFMGAMADNVGKSYDAVPFRKMLQTYGITAADWEAIRATALYDWKGTPLLRGTDIADDALRIKFLSMLHDETEFAVPGAGRTRSRAFLRGNTKPGTLLGEMARSFGMFKNFPVSLVFTHWRRGLNQESASSRARYLIAFGIGSGVMGMLGLQMQELSKGREPLPMDDARTWGSAILKGGGLAIWGDFLFADRNRFGGGIEQTLAGPVAGLVNDTLNLTVGNAMQLAQGEDTNFPVEALRFVGGYMPGQSTFYLRLAWERMVMDQLEEMADPRAARRWRREERKYRREFEQDYYWAPGDITP